MNSGGRRAIRRSLCLRHPEADLSYHNWMAQENAKRLQLAEDAAAENDELMGFAARKSPASGMEPVRAVGIFSISDLYRQNLDMLRSIGGIDKMLQTASESARKNETRQAIQSIDRALDAARAIQWSRNKALRDLQNTWYKSCIHASPKRMAANSCMSSTMVKDHLPDRTIDMSYLFIVRCCCPSASGLSRFGSHAIQYAPEASIAMRNDKLDWKI